MAQGFQPGAKSLDFTLWWNDNDDCIVSWSGTPQDAIHDGKDGVAND